LKRAALELDRYGLYQTSMMGFRTLDSSGSEQGEVSLSGKHGIVSSACRECGKFLDWL